MYNSCGLDKKVWARNHSRVENFRAADNVSLTCDLIKACFSIVRKIHLIGKKKNVLKKACFYPCKKILKFVKTPPPKFYGSILDGSGFYVLWFIITDQGLSVLQKKLNAFVSFLKELF